MQIESIALFTDFSDNAEIAFSQACELAHANRSHLQVVHVVAPVMIVREQK